MIQYITVSQSNANSKVFMIYMFYKHSHHRSWLTNLCQNPISLRTWSSPGCRSSSSPSPSAAAPAEPVAPAAASAGGPSAARPARPAPAASATQQNPAQTSAEDERAMSQRPAGFLPLCGVGPVWAGWAWCSSRSLKTEEPASSAAPGTAAAGLAYGTPQVIKVTFTARKSVLIIQFQH